MPYLHRMSSLLAAQLEAAKTGKAPPTGSEREQTLLRRFLMGREELGRPAATVLWYASFGDEHAAEPSAPHLPPPRPVALAEVMPPYRDLALGEDPIFFERPLCEFVDASSDQVLRDMHDGLVPRAYTSYALPIWPRTARAFKLRFPLERLLREPTRTAEAPSPALYVRVTYVGEDVYRQGGDWEELNREAMPTRLLANGCVVHDFLGPFELTQPREFALPAAALAFERLAAMDEPTLELAFEARFPGKVTYRCIQSPVAELWILATPGK